MWAEKGPDEAAGRLRLIADTYAGPTAAEIALAVVPRIELMIAGIAARAAEGDPGLRNLVANGEQERDRATLDRLRPRIHGEINCRCYTNSPRATSPTQSDQWYPVPPAVGPPPCGVGREGRYATSVRCS